jgi:hypothetical protein
MSNPSVVPGYCRCGCGSWVGFWENNNNRSQGYIKGEPKQFVHGHYAKWEGNLRPDYAVEDRGFDTPCWVWQKSKTASGHGQLRVGKRIVLAHRHYYEREKGPIPEGMRIAHLCGVRACVNPAHLEVVSVKESVRRSASTKLSKSQVENIRREASDTGYYEKLRIARKYGISHKQVYGILRGRSWAD